MPVRRQRLQFQRGNPGSIHLLHAHGQRRPRRVIGNEAPFTASRHAPQIGLAQVTTQAHPRFDDPPQGLACIDPLPRLQVPGHVAPHSRTRRAQLQAFTLRGKATVLGHCLGQLLLEHPGIAGGSAAPGLTA
ncbi:hypothetical protein D3C80_1569040 [compost metagenome]